MSMFRIAIKRSALLVPFSGTLFSDTNFFLIRLAYTADTAYNLSKAGFSVLQVGLLGSHKVALGKRQSIALSVFP